MEHNFDLTTRVDNKPLDCGKRISYNEIILGNTYYVLYDGALHKIIIDKLLQQEGTNLLITYLTENEFYLGTKQDDKYIISLDKYNARFYETK